MFQMEEPTTRLVLEAPGGLVRVTAQCHQGKVESVNIRNVPSFVSKLDVDLEVGGLGSVKVDIAYGGDSFVIVNADDLDFALTEDEARDLAQTGIRITRAANEQFDFTHPDNAEWSHISFCQFAAPIHQRNGIKSGKNTVAIQPGKLDRSPCGTGCSARLAVLHARGEIGVGETFVARSIIDSKFECRIEERTQVGSFPAIVPTLTGRAWITGFHQHMLDPNDPWPLGYKLSDTWPMPKS